MVHILSFFELNPVADEIYIQVLEEDRDGAERGEDVVRVPTLELHVLEILLPQANIIAVVDQCPLVDIWEFLTVLSLHVGDVLSPHSHVPIVCFVFRA